MIGTIKIADLKIMSLIGVYPEERNSVQEISLDFLMKTDMSQCIKSDSLQDTVDYDEVCQAARDLFSSHHYFLLEKCGYELICLLFRKFPLLYCAVNIKKKGALEDAGYAAVSLEMSREDYLCLGY